MSAWRHTHILPVIIIAICAVTCSPENKEPVLKDVFSPHFLIGAALSDDVVMDEQGRDAAIVRRHCNTITAENVMKWASIHPSWETYVFEPADRFVAFGQRHNMVIIGHTLVWHNQTDNAAFVDAQGKLLSRDAMLARLKEHITTVVGRYKGKVKGWDVVNEALTDEGPLRTSLWVQTIGEDFIAKAFEFAHEADPDAELYYNDFSLDKPAKRDAVVQLVKDLQARGLRVDGVGIQGHWGMDYPTTENLEAFLTAIGALGIKALVTEMDVDILPPAWDYQGADINAREELRDELNPYPDGLPDTMQTVLANRYAELFSILVKHSQIVDRVTLWGVTDSTSWLNDWPVRGRTSYPLLFDREYKAKPAFQAVVNTARAGR